jgi:hypothetical protein
MERNKGRKRLPPYISYRTFQNFIERLQQGIPARIDRSYWSDRLSGSTGTQLMSALRYLGLIDADAVPTDQLRQLVSAKGEARPETLRQITYETFSFLLRSPFDSRTATYAQLEEAFRSTFELTDSVSRKCVKFFVALASDAGMPLSPFITRRLRSVRGSIGTRLAAKKRGSKTSRNLIIPQAFEETSNGTSWEKMLLTKFPAFDPTWPDEVKLKWFEAFYKLLERESPKGKK